MLLLFLLVQHSRTQLLVDDIQHRRRWQVARLGKERWLQAWFWHERMTVAMVVAEMSHTPREQRMTRTWESDTETVPGDRGM